MAQQRSGAGEPRPRPARITASARRVVLRRCRGACESCGLEWPWTLSAFVLDEASPRNSANLVALCLRCSEGRSGPFAPLLTPPTLRERLRTANNRRTGASKLTDARRRRLIESRGGRCEACGADGSQRQLDVHHRVAILRGGDDADDNLTVLCFACHHHLQPCATGCGAWAKKPALVCRHCRTRQRLHELLPDATWDEIKNRFPAFVKSWRRGYEPKPLR
jgi:5-methylcytosine-specific restriction endonuclease McrA